MISRGFTLIEFAVVVICIAILSGLLLDRVYPLFAIAEETAFNRVRSQLASALMLEAAQHIVRGDAVALADLDGSNPMDLLLSPPANYVGPRDRANPDRMSRRVWYFDSRQRTVVYRPGANVRIDGSAEAASGIELYVRVAYQDRDDDGSFDPTIDRFAGVALQPLHTFSWAAD